jgi:hypothetical protein
MSPILAHFIGDFILQNDKMASNKKKSSLWCGIHVVCYMLPFLLCGLAWWQLLLIAAQHFAIDRTGFVLWFMKVKGQASFASGPCSPWSVIVVDNILHILWIAFIVWLPEVMK